MKKKITARFDTSLLLSLVLISTLFPTSAFGVYKKINPPPVDKIAHPGSNSPNTCWLATAAYTPEYDSNGHLSLLIGELSGNGNISMVDNHEIGLFSYATNGGIIGVEDWYC